MIDYVIHHQAIIREAINGAAFVLFSTLSMMVVIFLYDTWSAKSTMPSVRWGEIPGVRTAQILWWIFAAESYRTFNVWLSYSMGRPRLRSDGSLSNTLGVGIFDESSVSSTLAYLAAGSVLVVSLLRAITIFTPPDWRRVWMVAVVVSVIVVLLPNAIH